MNAEEIIKLNSILIGNTLPSYVGGLGVEERRLDNLDKLIEVNSHFMSVLWACAFQSVSNSDGAKAISNRAKEYIHELKVWSSEMESEA